MDLTRAQKVRLGIFVAFALVLLLASIAALVGASVWRPHVTYRTRFEESIAGLERNAPVRYQGLHIGHVDDLRVAPDNPRAIEITLVVDPSIALFEGTTAVLDGSGVTGLKTINLTPGDVRRPRLTSGAMLPSNGSLIDRLTDHAAAIVADVRRVSDQLARWASDDNRNRVENLLTHLDSFIAHLDGLMTQESAPLGHALTRAMQTAQSIGNAADQATRTMRTVDTTAISIERSLLQTLAAVRQPLAAVRAEDVGGVVRILRQTLARLDDRLSSDESGRAIASFGGTMQRLDNLIGDVDMVLRAGREDFTASLSYIRQAAEDLREFSRILAQNPSVLVRGRGDSD